MSNVIDKTDMAKDVGLPYPVQVNADVYHNYIFTKTNTGLMDKAETDRKMRNTLNNLKGVMAQQDIINFKRIVFGVIINGEKIILNADIEPLSISDTTPVIVINMAR